MAAVIVLLLNAISVLSEDRFLARSMPPPHNGMNRY
jgi:Yos1-like